MAPAQFQEFKIIAHVPNKPGQVLVFPAVQTYSDGSSVHWIGEPSSDTPAPRVTLAAAESTTVSVTFHDYPGTTRCQDNVQYKLKTMLRRYLSEVRDNYVVTRRI